MGLVAMTPTCLPCRPVLASRGMDFFCEQTKIPIIPGQPVRWRLKEEK